jgi:hypothetical protein
MALVLMLPIVMNSDTNILYMPHLFSSFFVLHTHDWPAEERLIEIWRKRHLPIGFNLRHFCVTISDRVMNQCVAMYSRHAHFILYASH